MIQIKNIDLTLYGKLLFRGASLTVHSGEHVGLTGNNGCGKSTLFGLIMHKFQVDAGDVYVPDKLTIAHMAQEVKALSQPAIDYVLDGDKTFRNIERLIKKAEINEDNDALADLYDQYSVHNGYTANARAEQLLHGLGFKQDQINKPVNDFSGGWRMRLNLAQTLMCPSDLLLLDEPTNHLDLDAIYWLESWLKQYQGTLIFISHDKIFLDKVADNISHIEHKKITLYTGNYSAFEKARAEKLALQQSLYDKQQRQKAHLQQFIDRFKAKATKARQAQSRIKALSRMEEMVPAHVNSPFSFTFVASDKMSDPLLSIRDGVIGYNKEPWLKNINISLHPYSRIGLLGPNGAGKSTLIKSLVNDDLFLSGGVTKGEHLSVGYFSQHQLESLDLDASPTLHIQRLSPEAREQEVRDFLGSFDFHGDKALELVSGFSGGEQVRLAIAIIAWKKPNLLLLDEPTNHLDLDMRYALTIALQAFEGAVVLIAHDRSLLEAVTEELWLVHNNTASRFDGDLNTYAQWLKDHAKKKSKVSCGEKNFSPAKGKYDKKKQRRMMAEDRKKTQSILSRIKSIEESLALSQAELSKTEKLLGDSELYSDDQKQELSVLLEKQSVLTQTVLNLEDEWVGVNEILEQMKKS